MSNRAMTWAIGCKGLQLATKAVLMLLADCHNGSNGKCFPNEDWLIEHTGLAGRTVRMHLKALEEAKLIDRLYKHGGRGMGRKFAGYELNIGINEAIKEPQNDTHIGQDIATAESCHGRNTSLPRQDTATPYKEEPETNRKSICGKSALGKIWPSWSSAGRKRSDSKTKLTERLNRLSKSHDIEKVCLACTMYAKATDGQYHMALNRFLQSGQWENWIGQPTSTEQLSDLSIEDWRTAARAYVDLEVWPRQKLGPAPHEHDCQAPAGLIRSIANQMQGHRWEAQIQNNITPKEAAA